MIIRSVTETRETLADLVGQVQYGGERVAITKRGKVVAAIISVEEAAFLDEMEDRALGRMVEERLSAPDYDPTDRTPADEFFRQLRDDDAGRPADAAE